MLCVLVRRSLAGASSTLIGCEGLPSFHTVAIDMRKERVFSLADAAKLPWLPRRRRGKRPAAVTIWRWTSTGCHGILLESVSVGNTTCVSEEALIRFFSALTQLRNKDRELD